jgi:cell wall-associated NlpC family hydrolase
VDDSASADTAAITRAKQEAQTLRALIDDLEEQLDAAVEEYDYATAMLAQSKTDAERTQSLLDQAGADLARAEEHLAERLVAIYEQGDLGVFGVLLRADTFTAFMERMDALSSVSADDARLVDEVRRYRDLQKTHATELAEQIARQTEYAAQAEQAKTKVKQRLAANSKALAGKEAQIARLVKQEAERQARLAAAAKKAAEERARKARLAAQAKAKAKAKSAASSSGTKVSVPASATTSDVVNIALKYLGCRYVWAGSSPSGFDCSGFVMYVYSQVGVHLPHSSRMQYGCGVPVSRADLQPGDLLFFYRPIHHVAVYIGDGRMVHAAGVGKGVRVDEVWARYYNCACRIIR